MKIIKHDTMPEPPKPPEPRTEGNNYPEWVSNVLAIALAISIVGIFVVIGLRR